MAEVHTFALNEPKQSMANVSLPLLFVSSLLVLMTLLVLRCSRLLIAVAASATSCSYHDWRLCCSYLCCSYFAVAAAGITTTSTCTYHRQTKQTAPPDESKSKCGQ